VQTLADQVGVVTGAARGIGRGIASVLAAEGATVVVVDVDADAGETAAAELRARGSAAIATPPTSPTARRSSDGR
jgi:2-hydroxycyclohexanecarboxyl-CoA dehydrogenase